MKFTETDLRGAFVIDLEPVEDRRGFFATTWSRQVFQCRGLDVELAHCGLSFNTHRGTLRGMHFQIAPYQQVRLVRCTRGAIHDVMIDLRRESATFARSFAVDLTQDNRRTLYVPKGFAHGFQTLADGSEVFYQISQIHAPEHERGVRWDDPLFGLQWPLAPTVMSDRDRSFPDFRP